MGGKCSRIEVLLVHEVPAWKRHAVGSGLVSVGYCGI